MSVILRTKFQYVWPFKAINQFPFGLQIQSPDEFISQVILKGLHSSTHRGTHPPLTKPKENIGAFFAASIRFRKDR